MYDFAFINLGFCIFAALFFGSYSYEYKYLKKGYSYFQASVDSSFIKCVTSNLTSKTILENRKYPVSIYKILILITIMTHYIKNTFTIQQQVMQNRPSKLLSLI